jgi:hypothetical protein
VTGPIFIAGLAFCGKTPLRIALNAHPRISVVRHAALWSRFYGRFGDLAQPRNLQRCLDALLVDDRVLRLEPDRRRVEEALAVGPPTYGRLFGLLHEHHARRLGKPRWGEQAQELERYADAVFSAYPDARIIHMVHDPRTGAAARGAGRAPGKLGWETARWLDSAALALQNLRRYPDRYRVMQLEVFAARPEPVLRDLASFLGEDYHPAMREAVRAHRTAEVPGPALVAASLDELAAFVERCTRAQLRALGYVVPRDGNTRAAHWAPSVFERPFDLAGLLMGRAVHRGMPARGAR